jgi:hypothetical protein
VVGVSEAGRTYKFPKHQVGRDNWFAGLMKRLHKTTLRQRVLTSLATVSVFNKMVVHTSFDVSEEVSKVLYPRRQKSSWVPFLRNYTSVEKKENDFLCHIENMFQRSYGGQTGVVHGDILKQSVEKRTQFCGELKISYHETRCIMKLGRLELQPRASYATKLNLQINQLQAHLCPVTLRDGSVWTSRDLLSSTNVIKLPCPS